MKDDDAFRRERRHVAWAWIALLLLMSTSLASSYLKLGPGNLLAGVGIAIAKTAIVAWLFMRLRDATALVRLVAVAGIGAWLLLVALGGLDYVTRPDAPTAWQVPQQLQPVLRR